MAQEKSKNLWGKPFRIVNEGLAETDVVIFIERLMNEQRKTLKKLEHLDSLHDLATQTIEDAEKLAEGLRHEGEEEGKAQAAGIVLEGEARAREIVGEAETYAANIVIAARQKTAELQADSRRRALVRIDRLEAALQAVSEEAVNELAGRMSAHYIGKYLRQSVRFLAAFEQLMRETQRDLSLDLELAESDSETDTATSLQEG